MTQETHSALRSFGRILRLALATMAIGAAPLLASRTALAQSIQPTLFGLAGIGDLSIRVIDLDLNDGIDASFEFLVNSDGMTGYAHTNMEVTSNGAFTQVAPDIITEGFLQFPSFQGTVDGVTGSVVPLDSGVVVTATATGTASSFLMAAATQTLAYEYMAHALWMAPHTQLDITLDAFTFAAVAGTCYFDAADCGYVQSSTFLQGSTMTSTDTPFATQVSEANFVDSAMSLRSGSMTISLSNFAAEPDRAYLYANAVVQGVTPVPEPSTYMLMLAGLLGVGWITRRRVSN